jgi:hypothetical protein
LIATLIDCEPEGRLRKFIETENITSSKSMDSFILTLLEIMKKLYDQSLTHKRSNEYFRQSQKAKHEEKVESKTPRKPFFAAHKQAVNNVSYQFADYEDEYDSEDFDAFGERRTVALEQNNPFGTSSEFYHMIDNPWTMEELPAVEDEELEMPCSFLWTSTLPQHDS